VALLGGVRIYDHAPQAASFPFITLGQSVIRDWSTGTEDGAERGLTLHAWSRAGGKKEMQEIIEAIRTALHDKPLMLEDHYLVNLRQARLDPDGRHVSRRCALSRGDRAGPRRRRLGFCVTLLSLSSPGLIGRSSSNGAYYHEGRCLLDSRLPAFAEAKPLIAGELA
jgi:hypothetical protein